MHQILQAKVKRGEKAKVKGSYGKFYWETFDIVKDYLNLGKSWILCFTKELQKSKSLWIIEQITLFKYIFLSQFT